MGDGGYEEDEEWGCVEHFCVCGGRKLAADRRGTRMVRAEEWLGEGGVVRQDILLGTFSLSECRHAIGGHIQSPDPGNPRTDNVQ